MTDAPSANIEWRSRSALLPIWVSYILSLTLASLLYLGFAVIRFLPFSESVKVALAEAEFLYLFGGFFVALVLLILPWMCIAMIHKLFRMARFTNLIYFIFMGALLFFCLNCLTSMPVPFDFGQTTRLQIILTAAHNQGFYFLSCGALFGATYCILGVPKAALQACFLY